MALKKSELYSTLWQSCDELRGGMDASQYKDYVLAMLFIKYVSDKFADQKNSEIVVPPGASFAAMVNLKGKTDIGDQINKKIAGPLFTQNSLGLPPDFNDATKLGSGKEMVDRLTNLIAIFENPALNFARNQAEGDDLLGDAYEYLMRHFATESGKSKGQFYTPAEVSRVMAELLGIRTARVTANTTVYDPTCGSGSLLIRVGDTAYAAHGRRVSLYGQEKDLATSGLARMNAILHAFPLADIKQGNTLANPLFLLHTGELETFDYVVANPPFSDKRWNAGLHPDEGGPAQKEGEAQNSRDYGRFANYGVPPAKQGDYAYLLHIVRSLKHSGTGACILPHGVLFRGNAEAVIRKSLIQHGLIKAIIGLPPNLFYGTGIPACIIVLDKAGAPTRDTIFMIDASRGFAKDGPKNRLREQDIHRIVDVYIKALEVPRYSRKVPLSEIRDAKNDCNLNLPRYIDSSEPEDFQDITAHLRGGIPNRDMGDLQAYWDVMPGLRKALVKPAQWPGYSALTAPATEIKRVIQEHAEFAAFKAGLARRFDAWKGKHAPAMRAFGKGSHPKQLVQALSESLLGAFEGAPLADAYSVYQHLMDYWAETMQDDCHLIAADGWAAAAQLKLVLDDKDKKNKARPDLVQGKKKYLAELIPPTLVVARYFANEQAAADALEQQQAALAQQLEEMAEEHAGEGGLLEDAKNDKDRLTKASVTARLKELGKPSPDTADERQALQSYLDLAEQEAEASAAHKAAHDALQSKLIAKYGLLTEAEVKALVVDDKWLAAIAAAVQGELDRVSQALTGRVSELAERYAAPLPDLTDEVEKLAAKVTKHLLKMGVEP